VQQKGRILIVEPDDLIGGLLERWLGEAGYTVIIQALRELSDAHIGGEIPQLVIADVPSPRSAEKIIHALRQGYASPILVISARFRRGLGSSTDVARQLGVRRILPKPFTRGELLAAVGESIDVE
jgi:DNA-binding response OmpR family regulator